MTRLAFICLLVSATAAHAAEVPAQIPLWPNGAPGVTNRDAKEIVLPLSGPNDVPRIRGIHNPSITPFLPPADKATGAAMVIAPGGGHTILAIEHEGYEVARYLNSVGVAAFVLKYRLAREPDSHYKVDVDALADAQRSIRLIRSRAAEWRVNPKRVGIMGFSAGGELAFLASTQFDRDNSRAADPIDRLSSRPDFQALIYPGGPLRFQKVLNDTPPAFLLCADNDQGPALNVSGIYSALKAAGVPAEVHIFASGGHGFGIKEKPGPNVIHTTWYVRLRDWMADRGLLTPGSNGE
ncbi:MAG: alpha/beta hydrolase [Bryobacteraceae bacterium]